MSTLTESINGFLTPELFSSLAARTGVPDRKIQTGMTAATGAIMDGLADRAQNPRAMDDVVRLVQDTPAVDDPTRLLDEDAPIRRQGSKLLGLVSDDTPSMIKRLASSLGVGGGAATSLLGAAGALVMAALGKFARSRGGLDASSLSSALIQERSALRGALPTGVPTGERPAYAREPMREGRHVEHHGRKWPWLLALVPILLLGLWLFNRPKRTAEVQPPTTAPLVREPQATEPTETGPQMREPAATPPATTEEQTPEQREAQPTEPAQPSEQAQPSEPAEPQAQPGQEAQPQATPTEPTQPSEGAQPQATPTEPTQPSEGAQPQATPTEPTQPGEEAQPQATPTEPTQPGEETQPQTTPTEPTQPTEPMEGAQPSEEAQPQATPTEPTQPSEEAQPQTTPTEPTQPTEPMEGAQPSEEAQPQATPTEPMEGAQPSEEAQPQATPTEPMEGAQPSEETQPQAMGTEPSGIEEFPAGTAEAKLRSEAQNPTGKSQWVTLDTVKFDTGNATLSPESNEQIDHVAEILEQNTDVKIEIGGFTDATGSAKVNQQLSQERADAVRQALIDKGIDESRIQAKGYGSKQPAVKTAGASAENRRVAARIIAG